VMFSAHQSGPREFIFPAWALQRHPSEYTKPIDSHSLVSHAPTPGRGLVTWTGLVRFLRHAPSHSRIYRSVVDSRVTPGQRWTNLSPIFVVSNSQYIVNPFYQTGVTVTVA